VLESTRSAAAEPEARPGVIKCAAYERGRCLGDVLLGQVAGVMAEDGQFVWIGLYEPSEELLRDVQREFGLHDLAIEDAHLAHQRPKVELYDDSLFVVLRTVQRPTPEGGGLPRLEFGETHVFLGDRYVVTVRHGSLRSYVGVRARCEAKPQLLAKGPAYVLYALMDFVVDQYLPVVEALADDLEGLEEEIFEGTPDRETITGLYRLKRELLSLKRAIFPLVEMCARLTRPDLDHIPEDTRPYFRDVHDQVMRINEAIDGLRELLTAALESHLSLLSVSQNADTRRLAAWAAIIAVPTMMAGIYGMNFEFMPELRWELGYPLVIGGMMMLCVTLFRAFKRSGWL